MRREIGLLFTCQLSLATFPLACSARGQHNLRQRKTSGEVAPNRLSQFMPNRGGKSHVGEVIMIARDPTRNAMTRGRYM